MILNDMVEFEHPLMKFFEKISNLQGNQAHLDHALSNYSTIIESQTKNNLDRLPKNVLGVGLIIRDATGETSSDHWKYSFPASSPYILKLADYNTEMKNLVVRENAHTLAQAYEAFGKFLKDFLILAFEVTPAFKSKLYGKKLKIIDRLISGNRNDKYGKNNEVLFGIFKEIAPGLAKSEKDNNLNIDFELWYSAFSFFRHKQTHSGGLFHKSELMTLNTAEQRYLESNFYYAVGDNHFQFLIQKVHFKENLYVISEFAFLIFKEVAIAANRDWMVLKGMKEKYDLINKVT